MSYLSDGRITVDLHQLLLKIEATILCFVGAPELDHIHFGDARVFAKIYHRFFELIKVDRVFTSGDFSERLNSIVYVFFQEAVQGGKFRLTTNIRLLFAECSGVVHLALVNTLVERVCIGFGSLIETRTNNLMLFEILLGLC